MDTKLEPIRVVGAALAHDSAAKHVSGAAQYTDDVLEPAGLIHALLVGSTHARARLERVDLTAVAQAPGVLAVLTARDVRGENDVSLFANDEPVFARDIVECVGQPIFCIAAETLAHARNAARLAVIEYQPLPAVLTLEQAKRAETDLEPEQRLSAGDADAALESAPLRVRGTFRVGGQEHFYLEGQVCVAVPQEDGDVHILASTQNPTEIQRNVARVLGRPFNAVTVEVRRMGGGFGGKETQPAQFAAAAALAAQRTGRPVKLRLDRDDDMALTGKRHDFEFDYDAGFDSTGRIYGLRVAMAARCGRSIDLSLSVSDRAMTDLCNSYFLPHVDIRSRRLKTHTVSNTAFRGFGGPQANAAIERVIDAIALAIKADPAEVRQRNFFGRDSRNVTPYGQEVKGNLIAEVFAALLENSRYHERRAAIRSFNADSPHTRRGIAITPVTYGVGFTLPHLNQAGALVHIYHDGSVHLNHGGTEMGQGLFIKVAQVVAEEFQIDLERIKISATTTGKVPNTSPTAASSGSDLNGMAALHAARELKQRLVAFAADRYRCHPVDVCFVANHVRAGTQLIGFAELVEAAYLARVPLSATGFYKAPPIDFDRTTRKGTLYHYFTFGACVSEVIVDVLTGEYRVLKVDLLHDVGRSLNPAIDLGQIEGAFMQGMGWLTTEELVFDANGTLRTHAPSTYKIPACGDRPRVMNVSIWPRGENVEPTIHRSKAVGEPPLCLATSVFCALTDAVASIAGYTMLPALEAPATPEAILTAIEDLKECAGEAATPDSSPAILRADAGRR